MTAWIESRRSIDMLSELVKAYHIGHPSGGSLRPIFIGHNWRRDYIEFCHDLARDRGDLVGQVLAKMLLDMPDTALGACKNDGWEGGLVVWRDSVPSGFAAAVERLYRKDGDQ